MNVDPKLDLVLERVVDVPPDLIWRAWTEPKLLVQWFTPPPWRTTLAELDVRVGGGCRTLMEGPNGEKQDNTGCYLEVLPNRKLTFTDSLGPGFRPRASGFMTASIILAPEGAGTRYIAHVQHKDEADRQAHEAMGFAQGWGIALDQLVELMKRQ